MHLTCGIWLFPNDKHSNDLEQSIFKQIKPEISISRHFIIGRKNYFIHINCVFLDLFPFHWPLINLGKRN